MIPWDNVTISARAPITKANKRLRSLTVGAGRHGMAVSRGLVAQNGRCIRCFASPLTNRASACGMAAQVQIDQQRINGTPLQTPPCPSIHRPCFLFEAPQCCPWRCIRNCVRASGKPILSLSKRGARVLSPGDKIKGPPLCFLGLLVVSQGAPRALGIQRGAGLGYWVLVLC